MKRLLVCMVAIMSFMANSMAVEFAVIGSVSKVYEEPSQNSSICNQFDDPVYVQPGMAFVKTGETQNYWKVKFPRWGNGVYIPKKSCVGSETLDITDGDYVMKSGDDEYVVKIVSNGETYGRFYYLIFQTGASRQNLIKPRLSAFVSCKINDLV